jgi:hypothetical protein
MADAEVPVGVDQRNTAPGAPHGAPFLPSDAVQTQRTDGVRQPSLFRQRDGEVVEVTS